MQHLPRFLRLARRPLAALAIILACHGAPAAAQERAGSQPPISAEGATYLVRTTLIALSQANETGNYTVLRDLGAPGFREANDATRLGTIFASLRESGIDLSYTALSTPDFTQDPALTTENMLHLVGTLPGGSPPVAFEFLFQAVEGSWRLFGVSVNSAPAGEPEVTPPTGEAPEAETEGEAARP